MDPLGHTVPSGTPDLTSFYLLKIQCLKPLSTSFDIVVGALAFQFH